MSSFDSSFFIQLEKREEEGKPSSLAIKQWLLEKFSFPITAGDDLLLNVELVVDLWFHYNAIIIIILSAQVLVRN